MTEPTVKLVGFARRDWPMAMRMAELLVEDYPDRMGSYNGVGYMLSGVSGYTYRTATMIVVRSSECYEEKP